MKSQFGFRPSYYRRRTASKILSFSFVRRDAPLSGSRPCYSNKENHLPARVIHIHHSCNCTKQTVSCVGVASRNTHTHTHTRGREAFGVTRQPEFVVMTTPTKKHSQQRSGINSLADNVRRCFKWRNKCVCTVELPHPNSCGPDAHLFVPRADLWRAPDGTHYFIPTRSYFHPHLKNQHLSKSLLLSRKTYSTSTRSVLCRKFGFELTISLYKKDT